MTPLLPLLQAQASDGSFLYLLPIPTCRHYIQHAAHTNAPLPFTMSMRTRSTTLAPCGEASDDTASISSEGSLRGRRGVKRQRGTSYASSRQRVSDEELQRLADSGDKAAGVW